MSKYTVIFAHYDPDGHLDQYILTYLKALAGLSIRIIFVSNCSLSEWSHQALKSIQHDVIIAERHNKGFDFGSWKHAVDRDLISEDTDYLLLTNDSIFGPLFELAPLFEKMESRKEIDFWGLTDSYEGSWHLQSFFICLSRKVFRSDAFLNFFKQDFDSYPKRELVKNGEILLSTVLISSGFKAYAFSPYKLFDPEVEKYPAFAKNATHYYWKQLIKETQFPFVKKELILQNPENIQSIENLFPFLREISSYATSNIKEFLISTFNRPVKSERNANVSVIGHMYYPQSIYYFLLRLSALKAYNAKFFFNLSTALRFNEDFLDVLKASFPDAVILFSPSKGRDIGGKMVAINAQLALKIPSDYTLIIHDKLSPHSPLGMEWRNKLFQIIDKKNLPDIFNKFEKDDKIGVIGPDDLIKNEYNADENNFRCNSSSHIIKLLADYNLKLTNYNYIAGTIFWIRTSILDNFYQEFSPLSVRASFEEGNALDFVNGTNIHAWERIFPFLANAQGYKIKGI